MPSSVLQVSHAQSDLANTVLAVHNRERAEVGSPPLVWSDSLAADAKGWVEHLGTLNQGKPIDTIKDTDLPHSTGTGQGENIAHRAAWGTGPISPISTDELHQGWVDEKSYMGGHYTQMVWQNSREVGCGTHTIKGSATGGDLGEAVILVCRYSPPGNIEGEVPFGQGAAQAVGEEDAGFPPADQAVGEEGGGGDDGGGGDGGGDDGGDGN